MSGDVTSRERMHRVVVKIIGRVAESILIIGRFFQDSLEWL